MAQFLVIGGPATSAVACVFWAQYNEVGQAIATYIAPLAYLFHAGWLYYLTKTCKVEEQSNGSWVPTTFRSVLYLDVFGWIGGSKDEKQQTGKAIDKSGARTEK